MVISERVEVRENDSACLDESGLILTVRDASSRKSEIVVGYPGLPNETLIAATGDVIIFQTPSTGMFEVRVFSQNMATVTFLVTQISPRPGIAGAFATSETGNERFTSDEVEKISLSIEEVKAELGSQQNILPEQLALLHKELDEIRHAASRLGRKDWINYVAGAVTSTCASAAFAPDVTRDVFVALNEAFYWLFNNALQLLR